MRTEVKSLTERVWEYAAEVGLEDGHFVWVRLLSVINQASPQVVDAAFAELRRSDDS